MIIYLACTVRGDRCAIDGARALAASLQREGHTVLTTHLLADDVDNTESNLSEREIFQRDLEWLHQADVLVAEASGSSYGVGFEVGYVLGRADRTGQRVVLCYREDRRPAVSRLIAGNQHTACTTLTYRTPEHLVSQVQQALARSH